MREGWVETTFGDIFKIVAGKYVAKEEYVEGGEFWIYGSNSIMGKIDRFLVEQSHVVMAAIGAYAGAVRYSKEPSWINNNAMALVPSEKVMAKYLHLWLESKFDLKRVVVGTGQPYVQRPLLLKELIALPPLPEQKRIVDLISSVDSYIEALQQQLESIQSIRSSISESLWSSFSLRSKLSSFGDTLTGSTPPTKKQQYWDSHEVDFFTPSDLGASLKLNTASRGVSIEGAAISRPLKGYSVLQVCIGATIGKVGYLNHPAVMNQQINALTNLTEHDAPILAAILSSETFQSIIRNTAGGSTLPIISKSSWGEIQIPHVPEGERIKVSLAILESDSFIEQSRQLLFSAEKLRSSILHNLLTGTHEIPVGYDKVMGTA